MNYKEIISSVRNKNLEPVYFLMGDEPYYIDKLCHEFAEDLLTAEEKEFNQKILYGKETTVEEITLEAKQFPFGSEKRVVIVKEAQHIKKIENLEFYLENPQTNTVLVIAYKGKSIDKRKKFGKSLNKKCVVFESKKLYENQISPWILKYVTEKGFSIQNNATAILSEYLGVNLSKITNELNKLMLVVKKEEEITTHLIEHHIGISKDYNIFELQNALGEKDILKANKIITYFAANPKDHHIVPVLASLFSYFQKIMIYHFLNDKSPKSASIALKINPYFIHQYQIASRNYNIKQLFNIFKYLKEYDLKSKGVDSKNTSQNELLKELTFRILHA